MNYVKDTGAHLLVMHSISRVLTFIIELHPETTIYEYRIH